MLFFVFSVKIKGYGDYNAYKPILLPVDAFEILNQKISDIHKTLNQMTENFGTQNSKIHETLNQIKQELITSENSGTKRKHDDTTTADVYAEQNAKHAQGRV